MACSGQASLQGLKACCFAEMNCDDGCCRAGRACSSCVSTRRWHCRVPQGPGLSRPGAQPRSLCSIPEVSRPLLEIVLLHPDLASTTCGALLAAQAACAKVGGQGRHIVSRHVVNCQSMPSCTLAWHLALVAAAQLSVTCSRCGCPFEHLMVPPLSRKSENPDDKRQAIQLYLKLAGMVKNIEGVAPEQLALIHR